MWHCAVSERRKDNDGRAMQYSSISKGLAITGIVFTFVVGTCCGYGTLNGTL